MAEQTSTEVVPSVTQKLSRLPAAEQVTPAPATFDLGKPMAELDSGREPVTWAGGSLELVEVAEHRPTSALDRDPTRSKLVVWAIGSSVAVALILGFVLTRGGEAEAGEDQGSVVAESEIVVAPAPAPTPAPAPPAEPAPKRGKSKKSGRAAAAATTLAASSSNAASESSPTSKPASTPTSKPASTPTSKPASTPTSKPASTPGPAPSKPATSKLAPPEEDGGSSKAELPDVSGWDDQDAAVGDRSAEGV